jgi:hypothetical protein
MLSHFIRLTTTIFFCFFTFIGFSQEYNFHKPLSIPLNIGAYFGDLRPNHFHMGIDYRTNGLEGLNLHAISDGYFARVRITPYGYGKVVYINHPNGITSVYAHCSSFVGKLDSLVTSRKISTQSNEIELYLDPHDIPVKRGEVFALSGNTGSSTGPHLHFEIRETATDAAMNPLLFGLGNKDTYKPSISSIKIYGLSNEGYIIPTKHKTVSVSNGSLTSGNQIILPASFTMENGSIGIGISGHDAHANGSCGLYENKISCNNELIYHTKLDKVKFEETRYINTYKEFTAFKNGIKIHKLYKNQMNRLAVNETNSNGRFKIYPCDSVPISIETIDAMSNKQQVKFGLSINSGQMDTTKIFFPEKSFWLPNRNYTIELSNSTLFFDSLSLYEPTKKNIVDNQLKISFGDPKEAIHNPILISFSNWKGNNNNNKNYFIGYFNGNKYEYCETDIENDLLKTKALKFGTYKVLVDTIKPKITTLSYSSKGISSKAKTLTWTISDSESKIFKYDVFINNEWIPADYEYKTKQLKCVIKTAIKEIGCIQVIVTDVCGNQTNYETTIP